MIPLQIKVRENKTQFIKWDDNTESIIKLANLRRNCPCALCASEREQQGSRYIPIYSNEQLTIKKIRIVGNYAIGIEWADDHDAGIYEFETLIGLAI